MRREIERNAAILVLLEKLLSEKQEEHILEVEEEPVTNKGTVCKYDKEG